MRLLLSHQIQELDRYSQEQDLLSDELLMEQAGVGAFVWLKKKLKSKINKSKFLVLCGPGHNGADGLVFARALKSEQVESVVVLVFKNLKPDKLWLKQKQRANQYGVVFHEINQAAEAKEFIEKSDFIVDALFGIGLTRPLSGEYLNLVNLVNKSAKKIISLDIPSGIDSDSGEIKGAAIKATVSLSFGYAKPGLYLYPGCEFAGKVAVLPLSYKNERLGDFKEYYELINREVAKKLLPIRKTNSNKSSGGKLLVIAGNAGTFGAMWLTALAAYRVGSGYVYLPADRVEAQISQHPEILTANLEESLSSISWQAIVIGPGLGVNSKTKDLLLKIRKVYKGPVVVDADAITVIAQEEIRDLPGNWFLTPHSGELSRLLKKTINEIEKNRLMAVKEAHSKLGCGVLLKGYRSIICSDNKISIIKSGNAALSKAGSGDVLSGFIGGFMSQGMNPFDAVKLGAYIHGDLADQWVKSGRDYLSLLPSDLYEWVPSYLNQLRKSDHK